MRELDVFARFCRALVLDNGNAMLLEDFQRDMLADYFDGAVETLILLPKKNGKSTLLAAIALYHLITTPDAECVVGAASRDQATILYDQAAGFVDARTGSTSACRSSAATARSSRVAMQVASACWQLTSTLLTA
jgi:phage terminase large subunit-like protein